jgi:hypothetical protein
MIQKGKFAGARIQKYGGHNCSFPHLIDAATCLGPAASSSLSNSFKLYINHALSKNTWASYASGWNCFKKFEVENELNVKWPLPIETVRYFVVWCVSKNKLKSSTVKLYLSSLKLAHTIQGLTCENFCKDKIIDIDYDPYWSKQCWECP